MQLDLCLAGGAAVRRGYTWERHASITRASYQLLVDGRASGWWVLACGHQTALRPYWLGRDNGRETIREVGDGRKYARLEDARPALIALYEAAQ